MPAATRGRGGGSRAQRVNPPPTCAADWRMTSRRGRTPSICLARKYLPPRGVQIEEELPLRRVANETPRPADRGEARSARHGGDAVERGGGIGDQRAGSELKRFLAPRAFDRELAAVVARRFGQEERERDVGAHALHQRVVDVAAVVHIFLVAREKERRERLWPHREAKDLVG